MQRSTLGHGLTDAMILYLFTPTNLKAAQALPVRVPLESTVRFE